MSQTKLHNVFTLPYSPRFLFDIVANIESYPDFLPWCLSATIIDRNEDTLRAELEVGYKIFKEKFLSKVTLSPHKRIEVELEEGPFKHLKNFWQFRQLGDHSTQVEFYIDFEFRSPFLQKAMEVVFAESTNSLVKAFEKKAQEMADKKPTYLTEVPHTKL